jgi:hypothetical protein
MNDKKPLSASDMPIGSCDMESSGCKACRFLNLLNARIILANYGPAFEKKNYAGTL